MLTYFIFISYNLRYFPLGMQKKKKNNEIYAHLFGSWHCRKKRNIETEKPSFKLKSLLTVIVASSLYL